MREVKEGYKMTELGEIPNEWGVKTLLECSIGRLKYGIGAAAVEYSPKLPLYLRITDIDDSGHYIKNNQACVDDEESEKYMLKEGDIVFARTGNTVGKNYLYNKRDGELVYAGFLIKSSINDKYADARFIKKICETKYFWDWVKVMSTRSGQPGINAEEYGKLKLPVPPLPEQQKIADILSTVDEQIENVDHLIEKTKELKKGLMQQLLTKGIGHTEFKETEVGMIPKEWEVKKLGELANYINGRAFKPSEWEDDGIQIVRIQNLNGSLEFNYFKGEVDRKYYIDTNQLLFAWSGSRGTSFGPFIWKGQKAVLNQHIFKIDEISSRVNKQYLYYALKKITQEIEEMAHGSAGLVHVTKGTLEKMCIAIPSLEEQKKIANLLETTDNKILNHENQKKNLLNLKKGLMQQLLTGKIRVK